MDYSIRAKYDYSELQKGLLENAEGFDRLSNKTKRFESDARDAAVRSARNFNNTASSVDKLTRSFGSLVQAIGIGLGVREVLNFGGAALRASGNYEQLNKTFATFLKSGELGKKLLLDLQKLGIQTPLAQKDLENTAKTMLAFNFSAKEVIPTMKRLGDVSTGTGKNLTELSVIYGQVKLAGRLMGQDLLQFTNAGVPLIAELAKNFGVAEGEIKKMVERGKIGFKDVEKAFQTMTDEGGLFFNLMSSQSDSFLGKVEKVGDQFDLFKRRLGDELMPVAKEALEIVGDYFETFDYDKLKEFGRYLGIIIGLIKDYGPMLLRAAVAWYTVNKAVQLFRSEVILADGSVVQLGTRIGLVAKASRLLGRAFGSIGIMLLVQAVWYLVQNFQKLEDAMNGVTNTQRAAITASKEIIKQYNDERKEVDALFDTVKDANKTIKQRTEALNELKAIYPEYVSHLNAEKSTLVDIEAAQSAVNRALLESVIARKKAQISEEAYNKVIDNNLRIQQLKRGDNVGIKEGLVDLGIGIGGREAAIKAYEEQNKSLLNTAQETLNGINRIADEGGFDVLLNPDQKKKGGRASSRSSFLARANELEKAYASTLRKMTDSELSRLTASTTISEKQKQLVLEEIERRKSLTKSVTSTAKATEDYSKVIERLRDKLASLRKQNIGEGDPIKQLEEEEKIALEEIARDEKITLSKTKNAKARAEIERLYGEIRFEIVKSYSAKIQEAEAQLSEADLARRKKDIEDQRQLLEQYYKDRISGLNISNADPTLSLEGRRRNNESILQAEATQAENLLTLIKQNNGEHSEEYKKAYEDFILKNAAYHKLLLDNEKAYLNESIQIEIEAIDRKLEYAELSGRERQRLEIEKYTKLKEIAEKELSKQLTLAPGDTEEINRLKKLIADLNAQLGQALNGPKFNNFNDILSQFVSQDTLEGFEAFKGAILNVVTTMYDAEIESMNRAISQREDNINKLKGLINEEYELKKQGFANDYAGLQKKLLQEEALLKADKRKRLELQKSQLRQEAIIASAQQASALATAVANIIKDASKYGIPGLLIGAASIISMFAIWKNYKSQVKSLTDSSDYAFKGGEIKDYLKPGETAKSDRPGSGQKGHRVEGTNLRIGADEFLVNAISKQKNLQFLKDFNAGKFDNVDLTAAFSDLSGYNYKKANTGMVNVVVVQNERKAEVYKYAVETALKSTIEGAFDKQNRLIKKLDDRRPAIINYPDGSIDIITYNGTTETVTRYKKA